MKPKFDVLYGLVSAACEVNPEAEFPIPAGELLVWLDEMRGVTEDFAALKAQAQVVMGRLDSFEAADAPESDSAFYRLSEAISSLEQTMINRTSPVLEIAKVNHE